MDTYYVFSDGAQPSAAAKGVARIAPGGWGVLVVAPDGTEAEAYGGEPLTTVPRMEMTAALEGLKLVPAGARVVVTSDAQLLIKGMTEWLPGWVRRGWRTSTGDDVKNRDLWERLLAAETRFAAVTWRHVRGHTRDTAAGRAVTDPVAVYNERADRLAARGVPHAERAAAPVTPRGTR
jgi:ribonuclease HI